MTKFPRQWITMRGDRYYLEQTYSDGNASRAYYDYKGSDEFYGNKFMLTAGKEIKQSLFERLIGKPIKRECHVYVTRPTRQI